MNHCRWRRRAAHARERLADQPATGIVADLHAAVAPPSCRRRAAVRLCIARSPSRTASIQFQRFPVSRAWLNMASRVMRGRIAREKGRSDSTRAMRLPRVGTWPVAAARRFAATGSCSRDPARSVSHELRRCLTGRAVKCHERMPGAYCSNAMIRAGVRLAMQPVAVVARARGHPSIVEQALEAHAAHGQEPRSVAAVEHGSHPGADQRVAVAHEQGWWPPASAKKRPNSPHSQRLVESQRRNPQRLTASHQIVPPILGTMRSDTMRQGAGHDTVRGAEARSLGVGSKEV